MKTSHIAAAIAAPLLASILVLAGAAPASAHNYLVSSTPAEGETLTELPDDFSITTNDALLDLGGNASGFALQVVDADGQYYGDGCLTVSGATMTTGAELGEAGEYMVLWQAISGDGHTVSGEFGFAWAPEGAFTAAEGSPAAPVCGGDAAEAEPLASIPIGVNAALVVGAVAVVLAAVGVVFFATRRRNS